MCGIVGLIAFKSSAKAYISNLPESLKTLSKRGPDVAQTYVNDHVAFGHARLSIIDTSERAHQPFVDDSGQYIIVYNGEIFNYQALREELVALGYVFHTNSDTEVLLALYKHYGASCLSKLNGFFAFAIYHKADGSVFLARDRFGVKPLVYFEDEEKLIFASEHKAILAFSVPKQIDQTALQHYFQLNYLPGTSIYKGFQKLQPGTYLHIFKYKREQKSYYTIPKTTFSPKPSYAEAQKHVADLVEDAVRLRLISDVPLGTFLSGGIDSSVVTGLAARHVSNLHSFSIGFKDEPYFDETHYARLAAQKFKTEHTVFSLTNQDLLEHLFDMLDYLDEPFADSSALAVYILSQKTRQHVTVALSGDGADELFSGYHKHMAEYRMQNPGLIEKTVLLLAPLFKHLPQSKQSKLGNVVRQLHKFSSSAGLSKKDRYWAWASVLSDQEQLCHLLNLKEVVSPPEHMLSSIDEQGDFNQILKADFKLVLPNDMLTKVDLMSMANSLEVRTPFLDYRLVDYVFQLPVEYKIDGGMKKKILQDAFRTLLPTELYNRPKQGFEVPLLSWFRNELKGLLENDLLSEQFIREQNVFSWTEIQALKQQLYSHNPGNVTATIWALVVFQYWYKRYLS